MMSGPFVVVGIGLATRLATVVVAVSVSLRERMRSGRFFWLRGADCADATGRRLHKECERHDQSEDSFPHPKHWYSIVTYPAGYLFPILPE